MDKGERAGPGEPVHVPKSPELLRVGSSSIFYVFAGHVGGSGFLFRLAQKIGAMTQVHSQTTKSYLAIFFASRSTSVSSRPHSLPSTNTGHLLSSMVVTLGVGCQLSHFYCRARDGVGQQVGKPKSRIVVDPALLSTVLLS
jgi:hypothetical protein